MSKVHRQKTEGTCDQHAVTNPHAALGMLARLLARAAAKELTTAPSEISPEGTCAYPTTDHKDERRRDD